MGRKREIATAKRLFGLTRLVTLTGVGGVGKTRLAIQVGRQIGRTLPDEVCYVSLAELHDPSLLQHTVATSLGLHKMSGQAQPLEIVLEHLAPRRTMLVLDNCEHLLAFCADLAATLLSGCPDLQILATSREPLGIPGESTLPVPPLSVPPLAAHGAGTALDQYDAIGLFLDRAASAVPGFELTEHNRRAISELCCNLDGLPLALELAAVRLRALSPEQIVERLADRSELLAAGSGIPARQRTLSALMGWSFDLCTPDEQLLWTRLSVFAGGVELDAAEGICADDRITRGHVLALLVSLVDKSILIREDSSGRARYRLLETVREFGRAKLRETGELFDWRRRHRDWYSELVDTSISRHITTGGSEPRELLRRDHANLRAALDFCLGQPGEATAGLHMAATLYYYWLMGGHLSEGRHWVDLLLTADTEPSETRARALFVGASLATIGGDLTAADQMLDRALSDAEGNAAIRALVGQGRGLLGLFRDDLAGAIGQFEAALVIFEQTDDEIGEAFTLFLYGLAAALHGDSDKARAAHVRCQQLTESKGEVWIWSSSVYTIGVDAWLRGDHAEAMRLQRAVLLMKRPLMDYIGIAECIESIAWIEATNRRCARAATLFGASDSTWREFGMPLAMLPVLQRHRDSCERLARTIGKRAFEAAYREGARMTIEQALAFALEEDTPTPAATTDQFALTKRELEISELIGQGLSNGDIAKQLVVSRRTIEGHVQHLMAKLNFTSRTQVAAWVATKPGSHPAVH